jgi:regulator of protease activity HflC (stomatin/prohibitin superfamily)
METRPDTHRWDTLKRGYQIAKFFGLTSPRVLRYVASIAFVTFAAILLSGFKTVESDEACLFIRNGEIRASWGQGLHWRFTPMSDLACYQLSRLTYEASPGAKGGGAQYNDDPVEARTSDGQTIDAVSFRISFRVPRLLPEADRFEYEDQNLRFIYTEVGAGSNEELVASVITFYARPEVRRVMQLHASDELLYGNLELINTELEELLRPIYASYGVVLEDILVSKPDFNDAFEQRLEQRKQAEANVEIERQKQLQADEQNQTRINAANAEATVVVIQQESAAEQTRNQANVDATVVSVKAAAEGDRTVTQANAEATAIAVQVAAYGGPEGYLEAQRIEAMSGWPVQVIGESNAIPVIELSPQALTGDR